LVDWLIGGKLAKDELPFAVTERSRSIANGKRNRKNKNYIKK
jgi:hypothetical protein